MIRSLPSSRIVPALLLCLVTFLILVRVLFPTWEIDSLSAFDDSKCDDDGHCQADSLVKAPTRQEFVELQHTLDGLKSEVDRLKQVPQQKESGTELTPEQKLWESRRTECGEGVVRNIDYLHSVAHEKFWEAASKEFWNEEGRKWRNYMTTIPSYPTTRFQGRGIVMLGGNAKTLDLILVTLRMLREVRCKLPVEVWHLPGELTPENELQLRDLGATPRDFGGKDVLFPMKQIKGRQKNFQIKVGAWVNSGFEEIIGLDSDVMPLKDPSYLFETEVYKEMGQIFWPDWWKTHRNNPVWDILDTPCKDEWEMESGEVVYNKRQNWDALMLAQYFSENSELYFQLLNGDKDLLRFAHKALKKPYYMARFPTAGGAIFETRFCGFAFVQYDPMDQIIFVHANLLKEMPRTEFHADHPHGVFRVYKDYSLVHKNTWLKPVFQTSIYSNRPCMEFFANTGEPDIRERPFEELPGLEGFNEYYRRNGGLGGGVDDRPPTSAQHDSPNPPAPPAPVIGPINEQKLNEEVKVYGVSGN